MTTEITETPVSWLSFPAPLPSDGGQGRLDGALVGCGPQTAAALLTWWGARLGLAGPPRDPLAAALVPALLAWRVPLSGGQRAVQPWRWLLGLNAVLDAAGWPLRARGHWGLRPDLAPRLARNWAQGLPTAGFEFTAQVQHYGLLQAYRPGPQGLEGLLVAPLARRPALYLQPAAGLGGVFWLEERRD